jgi:hypothetical protein
VGRGGAARAGFIWGARGLRPRTAHWEVRAAMGRGWGFLVGLLVGAVWLLRSGLGEQQPPETAAQRCLCQVSSVRAQRCRGPRAPAGEGLGCVIISLRPGRGPWASWPGSESSAARPGRRGPVLRRSLDVDASSSLPGAGDQQGVWVFGHSVLTHLQWPSMPEGRRADTAPTLQSRFLQLDMELGCPVPVLCFASLPG